MNAAMEEVMNVVRSCLLTSKNGTTIDKLHKDYKLLEDRSIPYQSMGFSTLEAFMQRVPGVRITRRGSEIWVEAIPTLQSAHIARLVAGQKQSNARRRPQHFRHAAPARRPYGMSKGLRSSDTNQARNRSSNPSTSNNRNVGNNTMPAAQPSNSTPPRPLMQQPAHRPLMALPASPPSKPRYTGGVTQAQMASPSKRMLDRNIQPQQHLDYERNSRSVTGNVPVADKPRIAITAEMPRAIVSQQPVVPQVPLTPVTPGSGMLRPARTFTARPGPVAAAPMIPERVVTAPVAVPRMPTQPIARTRLCDRLVISQSPHIYNSGVTNGSGGIQVTFRNKDAGGDGPLTPDTPSQDPREELRKLVRNLKMQEPQYKTRPVIGKNGVESGVYGQVLIGSSKFSSYPQEAKTEKEAEILAARQAISELTKEHGSKFQLRETSDKKLIKERVLSIVDQHNGVFTHKIRAYYQEIHKENLPDEWMKDVEKWTEVTMDQGVDKSTILRRRFPCNDKVTGLPSPKVDKVLLNPIGRVEPGILTLPEETYWVVYVTTVISSIEIWIRLYGQDYSEQFDVLSSDMIEYYKAPRYPDSGTIEVGGYYALKEQDYWHRVRVIELDETTGKAVIFFIDVGDEDSVSTSSLIPLDTKFCLLPAQAMKVSLVGLEEFSKCINIVPRIEKILLDRTFYAQETNRELTSEGPYASVIFYDTSGPEDVNVNDLVARKVTHQLLHNVPVLEVAGHVTDVHASHVEQNGDVFIQVQYEGLRFLAYMLNKLTGTGLTAENLEKSGLKTVDHSKIYLARAPGSEDWYRARIIDETDAPAKLKIFLIDFGRTMLVDPDDVHQLDVLSPILAKYPAQAMKVRLHNIDSSMFDDKMLARLVELAPPHEQLLLKVVIPSFRGSPPSVELFKRNQPDNGLVAINNTLEIEAKLHNNNGDGNNNVRPRKRVERTNSRANGEAGEVAKVLKPPRISGIGEYFDVHVTMAANPGNFTVQPHEMTKDLQDMMAKLQETCLAYTGPHPSLESVREGRLYAAKHVDGNWYRVCISNVINEHMVTVYFCDYGDVTVITLDKLQRLQKQFLDLPYQAIKAKLVGIQPVNMDWAVEDAVRFQDLVVERDFVSVVMESAPDKHSPGDMVLGLKLIDVSTEEDVNIGTLLVEEGRATYTD